MTIVSTAATEKRNPYISKWYVLFDSRNDQWISFQPQVGCIVYPCYACKDMFGSRNSFLDHVNRRGLVLKYICGECRAPMNFYNTCSFLLHVRDHFTESGGSLDLDNVEISTIPMEIAGFMPIPNVTRLYDTKDDTINQNLNLCTKFYKPIEDCVGKRHVYFKSNDLVFLCSKSNNGTDLDLAIQENHALVICQVNKHIPKCLFVPMPPELALTSPKNKPPSSEVDTSSDNLPASDEDSDIICLDDNSALRSKHTDSQPKISCKNLNQLVDQTRKRARSESPVPSFTCSECNTITNYYIKDHFQGENRPVNDSYRCKRCALVLPTPCSFRAHCRMHDKIAPFICPECGTAFENTLTLFKHVEKQCFHLAKSVRWKCPARKCGKVFAQIATFTSHFPLVHMKIRFGCNSCLEYFASEKDYEQHVSTHDHSSEPCKKIHECTVCTVPINDIKYHVMTHIQDKENRTYVFICKYCRSYYRSSVTYAAHLLRCAKLLLNSQVKKEIEQIESHNDMKCKVIKFCRPCSSKIQFHCTYKDITTVAASCPQCLTPFAHDITSKTKFIQHEYTNNSFVQRNIDNNTYECILCDKVLTDPEKQTYAKHNCKYKNPHVAIDNSNSSIEDYDVPDQSSSSPNSEESNKKKRRRLFVKKRTSTVVDKSINDLSVTPVTFDGEYRCQLCSFTTESRPLFHDHIQEHRDVSTAYQCMECGECFVVKPSLHKHLQVFHSVENVESYLKENECYDKEAVRLLEESMRMVPGEMSEPVAENQCKICRQMFPDNAELSKHFRTHGMAFLLKKIIK